MAAVLSRLGLIVVAYLTSSLITGYVVYGSMYLTGTNFNPESALGNPTMGLFIAFMIAWFAAGPAALTVLIGEWRGWRMWWYYGIAGSLIGLALGTVFQPPAFFPWLGLSFGVVSGLIFWGMAGRKAGLLSERHNSIVMSVMGVIALFAFIISAPGLLGLGRF